jgi:hypothetical protein
MPVNNEYSVMALTNGTIADDLNSVEIRVCPRTSSGITEFSQHEAD